MSRENHRKTSASRSRTVDPVVWSEKLNKGKLRESGGNTGVTA